MKKIEIAGADIYILRDFILGQGQSFKSLFEYIFVWIDFLRTLLLYGAVFGIFPGSKKMSPGFPKMCVLTISNEGRRVESAQSSDSI